MRHLTLLPHPLELVAVGTVDTDLLDWLGAELDMRYGTRTRVGGVLRLCEEWLDPARRQVSSNPVVDALVELLDARATTEAAWLLGVTEADLHAPEREWVFGEATVGGGCAVISTARLRPSAQRAVLEPLLFRARVLKEALHELGHAAGIEHCQTRDCVMAESFDVDDVDRKGTEFCGICTALLRRLQPSSRG